MKQLKNILLAFGIVGGLSLAAFVPTVGAVDPFGPCSTVSGAADSSICGSTKDHASTIVKDIVNTLLYILGAVSVVVIIIGGILYTTSTGDPTRIKRAKETLTYAIVGLIVAVLAYAIVNYILNIFGK